MGRNNQSLTLIMSSNLATESNEYNRIRFKQLVDELQSAEYDYNTAIGSYKGQQESSVVIDVRTVDRLPLLLRLAFGDLKQESVLLIHGDRTGTLIYADGAQTELGTLKLMNSTDGLEAYTVVDDKVYSF